MNANVTVKKKTLLDLVDLKIPRACKVKINGEICYITSFLRKENALFVMLQGGYLLSITEEQYEELNVILYNHLKKYMFNK